VIIQSKFSLLIFGWNISESEKSFNLLNGFEGVAVLQPET
jgi:hypothetical protein